MRQQVYISLLTISLVLLTTTLHGAEGPPNKGPLGVDLVTSVGSQLDKTDGKASLTLEPTLSYDFGNRRVLELYSAIDRPFNQYERLTLPKTILTYAHGFKWIQGVTTTATAAATAISLDRWNADGSMLRGSVALTAKKEILRDLTLALKVGPYGQLNRYRQTTSGKDLPKYGLTEKMTVEYTLGRVVFDFVILFDQKYSTVWKNAYSTLEQAAYKVTDNWSLGLSHELLGSTLDDSTGLSSPFQVFHERNSRVSAFVEFQL